MDMIRAQKEELQKRGKKGFTLMEMLIVVAIIAILIAIAIPVFNGQLDKARLATDQANARDLKALVVTQYLSDGTSGTFELNAAQGTTTASGGYTCTSKSYSGTTISATIDASGNLTGNVTNIIAGQSLQ